jgi:GNAT superfamily N-acetyltransferase
MHPVSDAKEVFALTQSIRRDPDFVSNWFASPEDLHNWHSSDIWLHQVVDALVVLYRDENLWRFYYIASNVRAMSQALDSLLFPTNDPVVSDVVGTAADIERATAVLQRAGFMKYRQLERMQRIGPHEPSDFHFANVMLAEHALVPALHAFLSSRLDPLVERVPTRCQLYASVEAKTVLIAIDGAQLAGLLIYDRHGSTTTLRYWQTDARYQNRGIGGALIKTYFTRCRDARRWLLWVIDTNAGAIARYAHYGYRHDGLIDRILTKQTTSTKK